MEDRFKFKFFHNSSKKMFNVWLINLNEERVVVDTGNRFRMFELYSGNLLQSTGLKDKNGKLIYEGDIIRQRLSKAKFVIKYHNEYACFYEESKSFLGYFNDLTAEGLNSIEVIGNIYEDKELQNDKT